MSDELDYNSESDEDFCPDAKNAGESCSEEEEDSLDEEFEDPSEEQEDDKPSRSTKGRKRSNKGNKSRKSKKCSDDDSDVEEETAADADRRSTRQMEKSSNGHSKTAMLEKDDLQSDDEDKSRTDALWADFLGDVKTKKSTSQTHTSSKQNGHSKNDTRSTDTPKSTTIANSTTGDKIVTTPKQVTLTEVLDFAGEEVRVQKTVSTDSIKDTSVTKQAASGSNTSGRPFGGALKRPAGVGSSAGLGSILGSIGKKKKISVLEKSQLDWNSFKHNEGINEELQTHNKGKDGYLERQDFLQRTDLRQFEIEKNLRQTRRNQ